MKTEITDVFTKTAGRILETMTAIKVVRGIISEKTPMVSTRGVGSAIRFSGDVEGRILIDMDRQTAQAVAACMNHTDTGAGDGMVAATINELANIISGQAVTDLVRRGCRLKISPPTIFTGNNKEALRGIFEGIQVQFETELGNILVEIAASPQQGDIKRKEVM